MFAVQILMEAVVIVSLVVEQKRCRLNLAGLMATLDEVRVLLRILHIDPHCAVPSIGDRDQMRVYGRSEALHQFGKWIAEILVFATTEPMPAHHDPAAEQFVPRIQAGYGPAFFRGQQTLDRGVALGVEISRN